MIMSGARKTLPKRPQNSRQTNAIAVSIVSRRNTLISNPYYSSPPQSSSATPQYYIPSPQPRYVPTQTRANFVCILLLANVGTSFASVLISLAELMWAGDLFAEDLENNPVALALALLTIGLAVLQFVIFVATIVLFLMWLYRAHENLAAFGIPRQQLQYSSGWAVGSFFVPFANLIIPYRAIRELWQKSVPQQATMFAALEPPGFFAAWWGFWIAGNIADNIYFRLSLRSETPVAGVEMLGIVGSVLGIIAAFLAIKVVREIQRQQVESSKLIPSQPAFASPPAPPAFNQGDKVSVPSS